MDEQDCIRTIRACLISNPKVVKAIELHKDFEELEGKPFPFRQLGFSSFVDFLRSIPSAVKLVPQNGNNPEVHPIQTNASKHIGELVSKQRIPTKRRRGVGRRHGGYISANRGPYRRQPPFVPPSDYQAPQKGVYVRDIEKKMQSKYGRETLSRNGMQSSNDLLTCAGNMVQRNNDKVYPNMSALASSFTLDPHTNYGHPPLEEDDYYDISDEDDCDYSYYQKAEEEDKMPNHIDRKDLEMIDEEQLSNYAIAKFSKSEVAIDSHLSREKNNHTNGIDREDEFSPKMIDNFRLILTKHPDGIWSRDLPHKYLEETGAPLLIQQMGYDSVVKLASHLPYVFHCKKIDKKDFKLFDARTFIDESHSKGSILHEEPYIPTNLKRNVEELLNEFRDGIRSTVFQSFYEKHFKKRLNIEDLGFRRMEDFLENMKDVVIVRRVSDYCLVLPKFNARLVEAESPARFPALPPDSVSFVGRDDILKPGDIIPDQELPPIVPHPKPDDPLLEIEVRVGEVLTPHLFYISLDEKHVELETMMEDLDKFYKQEEHNFKIASTYLKENLFCACKYDGDWHRVRILQLNRNDVKILYIDYGTPKSVPYSELRYLHVDFSQLPAQAISSKLMGIQPINSVSKWSRECCLAFLDMVENKRLLAQIFAFHRSKNEILQLSIILYDLQRSDEIVFNEFLVEKGYAEFSKKAENNSVENGHLDTESTLVKTTLSSTSNTTLEESQEMSSKNAVLTDTTKNCFEDLVINKQNNSQAIAAPALQEDRIIPLQLQNQENVTSYTLPPIPKKPVRPPPGFLHITNVPPVYQQNTTGYFPLQHTTMLQPTPYSPMYPACGQSPYHNPRAGFPVSEFNPYQSNYIPQHPIYNYDVSYCNPHSTDQYMNTHSIAPNNHDYNTSFNNQSTALYNRVGDVKYDPITPSSSPYTVNTQGQSALTNTQNQSNTSLNNQSTVLCNRVGDVMSKPITLPNTPYTVNTQGQKELTNTQNQSCNTVKPAAQIMPLQSVESFSTTIPSHHVEISQNGIELENNEISSKSTTVKEVFNNSLNTDPLSSSSMLSSTKVENSHIEEATFDYFLNLKISNGSTEKKLSQTSDEYSSAQEYFEDDDVSETKNTTVENYSTLKRQSIESIPDSWENLDIDDTPVKSDNFNIDLNQPLDFLDDDSYRYKINLSNNQLKEECNNIKNKDDNSNLFGPIKKDMPVNWKDVFDPDVLSSSKSKEKEENKPSTLKISSNTNETLFQEIRIENKFFHLIHVNNDLAVIAQEFYPQFSQMNWTAVNRIVDAKYEPFPVVYRNKEPDLFKKLDNTEFNNGLSLKKRIKFRKTADISYISDIPKVLSWLKIHNETLLEELKILENNFKSPS